jgi:hypothetical protein
MSVKSTAAGLPFQAGSEPNFLDQNWTACNICTTYNFFADGELAMTAYRGI